MPKSDTPIEGQKRGLRASMEGAAMIFDFTGVMHPGYRQAEDPWVAAADDVAAAWRTVGDLLEQTMPGSRDGTKAGDARIP